MRMKILAFGCTTVLLAVVAAISCSSDSTDIYTRFSKLVDILVNRDWQAYVKNYSPEYFESIKALENTYSFDKAELQKRLQQLERQSRYDFEQLISNEGFLNSNSLYKIAILFSKNPKRELLERKPDRLVLKLSYGSGRGPFFYAEAFGHGLYFSETWDVAERRRRRPGSFVGGEVDRVKDMVIIITPSPPRLVALCLYKIEGEGGSSYNASPSAFDCRGVI